jgi:hypothetical protein
MEEGGMEEGGMEEWKKGGGRKGIVEVRLTSDV